MQLIFIHGPAAFTYTTGYKALAGLAVFDLLLVSVS